MRAGGVVREVRERRKVETVPGYVVVPPFQKVYSEKAGKGINLREKEKSAFGSGFWRIWPHVALYPEKILGVGLC